MLTTDQIGKRRPYTLKDFLEIYCDDIWVAANACNVTLKSWQETVVTALRDNGYKISLSQSDRKSPSGQAVLLNYLKLISVYAFSEKYSELLDEGCRSLATVLAEIGSETEKAAAWDHLSNLIKTLGENLDEIDSIIEDKTDGFSRLVSILCTNFFGKFSPIGFSDIVHVFGGWSFKDIAGTIPNYESLWNDAVQNQDPTAPNIMDLMSRPEDNRTIRMY